jgi:glycosyltransferase involved in cell wall biosynthesis
VVPFEVEGPRESATGTGRRPLKVLHLVDNLGMGGAETWLLSLLRHWRLQEDAPQNDFLATGGAPGIYDEEARALGARIFYLPYRRSSLPRFIRGFRALLAAEGYDAIHDHQDYASGWHYLIGAGRLPPVRVTHVHNPAYQIVENYGVTPLRRLTGRIGRELVNRYASHIAGTSRQILTEYGFDAPAFRGTPRFALHCGFETARFSGDHAAARQAVRAEFGWPADARIVLFVGRIDRSPDPGQPQNHKNSGHAVAVGIECARRDAHVRLLFAGRTGPALPALQQRVDAAGLRDRFAFAGIRRDVERLMLASDVLLFPSRAEGLGMVAVEAQAAGLPVAASTAVPRECVVVPELVRFIDLAEPTAAWADQVLQLASARADGPGPNARVAASPFSIVNSARALVDLYSGRGPP